MPNLIVSTCGTSLLTNQCKDQERRNSLNRLSNKREDDLHASEKELIDNELQNAERLLDETLELNDLRKRSAEINTILGIYDNHIALGKDDYHLLLHTDTYEGKRTAMLLENWLRRYEIQQVELHCCEKLNTSNSRNFQLGIANLATYLAKTLPRWKEQRYKVIFQLSGSFKSLQGFMQTAGMFYADEIVYIFETSSEVIRIPQMPIDLNAAALKIVADNLHLFRLFERQKGIVPKQEAEALSGLDLGMFVEMDDELAALTAWGILCWERAKEKLYSEKLLDSPHNEIVYGPKFAESAQNCCTSDYQRRVLNERIDDFATFLDHGAHIKRLDHKQLKGNPVPPSTHECDVWDEYRIFMHQENNAWLLDKLALGLHKNKK